VATQRPRRTRKPQSGCHKGLPTHGTGESWACRGCKRTACSTCVKHYWSAKSGHVVVTSTGFIFKGKRIATCPNCRVAGVLPSKDETCY